jgi:spore coat polysaccharide biosynthesis protein SpsF (cytidylyltransferase family)
VVSTKACGDIVIGAIIQIVKRPESISFLECQIGRLQRCKLVEKIVLAIRKNPELKPLKVLARKSHIEYHSGLEKDPLDCCFKVAKKFKLDAILHFDYKELQEPLIIDALIAQFNDAKADYANIISSETKEGVCAEVFTFKALKCAWKESITAQQSEQVTPYIKESAKFKRLFITDITKMIE